MKINTGGLTLEYEACAHCGELPKKEWLRKELEWWHNLKCGVCGVSFKVTHVTVRHSKDRDPEGRIVERWTSDVEREPWVLVSQEMPSGCDLQERFHEACLTKAFPFGTRATAEKKAAEFAAKKAKK